MKKFVLFSSYGVLLFKENVHYWPPYFVTWQIDAFVNNFHFKKSRHHIFIKICGLPQQKVQKMVFSIQTLTLEIFKQNTSYLSQKFKSLLLNCEVWWLIHCFSIIQPFLKIDANSILKYWWLVFDHFKKEHLTFQIQLQTYDLSF